MAFLWFVDVGLIRIDTGRGKLGARERENSFSEFSDNLHHEEGDQDSPSSYQHLMNDNTGPGKLSSSQYLMHMRESNSPITFENRHPLRSPGNPNGQFMTPGHQGRQQQTAFKQTFRSLSIDSNLDNLSSSDYPPNSLSPGSQTTRRGRTLQQRLLPPPLAAPEKRLNFITNSKTLSPEIRGSFVWSLLLTFPLL